MSNAALEAAIEAAWNARDGISPATKGEVRDAIEATLSALDDGSLRVGRKAGRRLHVNQWAKKAVPSSFRLTDMYEISVERRLELVGQGPVQMAGLDRRGLAQGRVSGRCRGPSCGGRPISPRAWC